MEIPAEIVWEHEDGEEKKFVGTKMEEKISPKEVWEWRQYFIAHPAETLSSKALLK
jgi:hypothetical protein